MAQGTLTGDRRRRRPTTSSSTGDAQFVDNAVDPTTGQIKIKGTFPNADRRLWPGQFVNVSVTLSTEPNAIVVPSTAIGRNQQSAMRVRREDPDQTVGSAAALTVERDERRRIGDQGAASGGQGTLS